MCRWITFISTQEILLSDIVLKPSNSLVEQSIDASYHPGFTQRFNHTVNADGFGVGWYSTKTLQNQVSIKSAVFRDTQPAWSNENLREICSVTQSSCVMAHVRAASPGMGVHLPNVHPFKAGRLLFCHNGAIQMFAKIRRKVLAQLSEEAFAHIKGTTDSECCFALILTNLAKDGMGPKRGADDESSFDTNINPILQEEPFGHERLYMAVKRTIRQLEHILKISGIYNATDVPSRMNFSLTDGDTVVCSRFCDRYPEEAPPSLYFCYGDAEQMNRELCEDEHEETEVNNSQHGSTGSTQSTHESDHDSDMPLTQDEFREAVEIDLSQQLSLPGKLLKEVDRTRAGFIVASDPLTKSNSELSWHRIGANCIIVYTKGSIPRLYKLKVGGAKRPEDFAFFLVDF